MTLTDQPRFVRADGPDKVTGSGRYTADLTLTGMLAAKFKYAGISSGRITKLDTSAAKALPGVLAVLTQDDVPDIQYSPGVPDRTLFAKDVVRFEGEIVAAVAALTPEIATAAVAAIVVEYEQLPPVTDPELAMTEDSPLVHADWASYNAEEDVIRDNNVASHSSLQRGDATAAMAKADHVLKSRYVADGCHAVPIEPRAVVAQWEGNKVTIWSSTQVPFDARAGVCETLDLPTNRVRVIVPHLGGGFGGKCGFHFEAHIAALARAAKRPVRLVFSRQEEFLAPDRRREGIITEVTTGVNNDGTIVARTADILIDCGAYIADTAFFPQLAAMHAVGPYLIDNIDISANLVYTNRQPSGSVRAPTAPQVCWALESHTDELAKLIDMDPTQFRIHNAVATGKVGPLGQTYDQIGLQDCIRQAHDAAAQLKLDDDEAIGLAIGWWPSFSAPSGAYVKIDDDGSGQIITGAQECGTGAVMTLRQLAADELGMDPESFEIIYQDTGVAPYDMGATGSQTLLNNGRAVIGASQQIAEQLRDLASKELEASPGDIVLDQGRAHVAGSTHPSVSISELAGIAAGGELLLGVGSGTPPQAPPIVGANCVGDQGMAAWVGPQFSCHAVRVKLDKETGVARVISVHAAHDSGTIINPLGAQGQVEGAILMGIGQALTEGTRYDEQGNQLNASLLEYKLQTCADAPEITTHFVEIATDNAGPHGAKGLAEAPNIATAAAIANALTKLTGAPMTRLPMTAERVWSHTDQLSHTDRMSQPDNAAESGQTNKTNATAAATTTEMVADR